MFSFRPFVTFSSNILIDHLHILWLGTCVWSYHFPIQTHSSQQGVMSCTYSSILFRTNITAELVCPNLMQTSSMFHLFGLGKLKQNKTANRVFIKNSICSKRIQLNLCFQGNSVREQGNISAKYKILPHT